LKSFKKPKMGVRDFWARCHSFTAETRELVQ